MSDDPQSFALARRHRSKYRSSLTPIPTNEPEQPSPKTTIHNTSNYATDKRNLNLRELSSLSTIPSSYTLLGASESGNIDINDYSERRHIDNPYSGRCQNAAVQNRVTGVPVAVGTRSSGNIGAAWYLFAVMLSLLGVQNNSWMLTTGDILATVEAVVLELLHKYTLARNTIQSIVREHSTQDVFATCLDVLLVFYALGFLLMASYNSWLIA